MISHTFPTGLVHSPSLSALTLGEYIGLTLYNIWKLGKGTQAFAGHLRIEGWSLSSLTHICSLAPSHFCQQCVCVPSIPIAFVGGRASRQHPVASPVAVYAHDPLYIVTLRALAVGPMECGVVFCSILLLVIVKLIKAKRWLTTECVTDGCKANPDRA